MPSEEYTTKFKVDISELKAGIQAANRQIKLANSEFKAASSGMDDWGKSADGISAKLKQLDTTLSSQKTILANLERQYELVADAQGEDSKAAQDLLIKINNQKAAIGNTEKEIRKYNEQLQALNSSSKESKNNLERLTDEINDQEKELSSLKEEYKKVVLEQGANSKEAKDLAKQISSLSNELKDNKESLNDVESAANKLDNSLEDAGKAAKDAESGFTILKGALANLAAEGIKKCAEALGALTRELITDSSNAYAQFAAATGTATDAMDDYKDAINNVYKDNFGESLADVADKMAKVKEVTGEIDPSKLQDMTEKAMTLEDVFDMDMTETLRGVNALMDHFGLTGVEAFDLIASGAQNGLNYTDELGDNVSEYAGKFAEAGFTSEEYFQLLKNGAEGGAYNLDKVNDAVNEVTTRLADGTIADTMTQIDEKTGKVKEGTGIWSAETEKLFAAWQTGQATQKDVMASIVTDIQNAESEQEKMNLAALAFGTMAEDGGTQFIEALTPVGDTFADVKGKADELAAVKYGTPAAAIQGIGRTLKTDLLGPLIDKLMPHLNDLAAWVTENLPDFIEKVKDVAGKAKDVATTIADLSPLFAALGTAIAGVALLGLIQNLGAIGAAVKAWMMSTQLMTAAQWLLNAAMSANPITLIIIAIMALVAAFVVLWNKSEAFREFWSKLWEGIKATAETVWEAISGFFTAAWETIQAVWDTVEEYFTTLFNAIVYVAKVVIALLLVPFVAAWKAIKKIWDAVKPYFKAIWNGITQIFSVVATWFGTKFGDAWNKIKSIWSAVVSFFKGIWDGITGIFSGVASWFSEKFTNAWNKIKDAWSGVKKFFQDIWDGIAGIFGGVKDWFGEKFGDAWQAIKDKFAGWGEFWGDLWTKIKDKFSDIGANIGGAISDSIKSGLNKVIASVESIINQGIGLINSAIDLVNKIPGVKVGKVPALELPRLYEGAVVQQGKPYLLEGRGDEAVVPLHNNKKWIAKTAKDLKDSLKDEGLLSAKSNTENITNNYNYNFNQTNNSPKSLSRLEIYRQTKNQLALIKA